jgi:opacity protein-like surface antigen
MNDIAAIQRRLLGIVLLGFTWLAPVAIAGEDAAESGPVAPVADVMMPAPQSSVQTPEKMEEAPGDSEPTGTLAALAARRGFSIMLQFVTNLIGAEDPGPAGPSGQLFIDEVGGGGQFGLGYAFTAHFSLGLALGVVRHRTSQSDVEAYHSSITIDARYEFLSHERARPYLFAGIGGTTLALSRGDLESEVRGGVALLGAGLVYPLTRHFALDFGARLDRINWTEVQVTQQLPDGSEIVLEDPVDDEGGAVKFLLGAGWKF